MAAGNDMNRKTTQSLEMPMGQTTETIPPRHWTRNPEKGQMTIYMVLVLGIFLIGFIGFGVDLTDAFFSRQKAQGAADASCQACAMDLLMAAQGTPTPAPGYTIGTSFDCASLPNATPCKYAALNGYSGTGLAANTESNAVNVTFPGSVPGVTLPPSSLAPVPFVQVTVTDRIKTYFASLLTGSSTQDVGASAVCGLQQANAPIPLIVLNPTCPHAFQMSGSGTTKIVGGPTKSIQINSLNQSCAAATTNSSSGCNSAGPTIDLTQGGPSFSGSIFGVFGAPTTAPAGFLTGTSTARWQSPSSPISDPFALTPAPDATALGLPTDPATHPDPYGTHGCPDQTQNCIHYVPGKYTQPIVVKNETAIFSHGIYYLASTSFTNANGGRDNCGSPSNCISGNVTGQCDYNLVVDSNGVVRMADPATDPYGDGSGGVMFYLSGPGSGTDPYGSVFFGSNAGNYGGRTVDPFPTAGMNCDGSSPDPALGIPASVDGNVLAGQCTSGGSWRPYQGAGNIRGILFFNDRENGFDHGQASMQGGGGLVLSGTLYLHHCNSADGTGLGTSCAAPPSGYQAFVQLQGSPGSGTYVLGNITTDQLVISGNGAIAMQLDSNFVYQILKVAMVQ